MIVVYNTNYVANPNSYLTHAILLAVKKVYIDQDVILADNSTLMPLSATGDGELLLCLDGQRLRRDIIDRVRGRYRTCALWLFEDPFMSDYNLTNADAFDIIFTNDPNCVSQYGEKGRYLPLAASLEMHKRRVLPPDQLAYDIFFAGTMWPNRIETLDKIIDRYAEKYRLKLICPTNVYLPPLPRSIANACIQSPVSHSAFVDFANASALTLTLFRDYASHGDLGQAHAPGPRLFELGLAGACQVVEVPGQVDKKRFSLIDGIACCDDIHSFFAEIDVLLNDRLERTKRAQAAQSNVAANHVYEHRIEELRREVEAIAKRVSSPSIPRPKLRKPRVLFCTHSTLQQEAWGGIEVYQSMLIKALGADIDFYFWLRRGSSCALANADGVIEEEFRVSEEGWLDLLCDADEERALSQIIAAQEIDVVHFQHLGHHAMSLPIIAKSSGAAVIFSVHDYFLICSRYTLLNNEGRFCHINKKDIRACDDCLSMSEGVRHGAQSVRRAFAAEVMASVDLFMFGTDYSRNLLKEMFPGISDDRLIVNGVPHPEYTSRNSAGKIISLKDRSEKDNVLRVAVGGNFIQTKGADIFLRAIRLLREGDFEFHILGAAQGDYAEKISQLKRSDVTYHGGHRPGDLSVLERCDIALFLSIWPETYSISLSEAWAVGSIPVASDIGAFSDRIRDGVDGVLIDVGDPGRLASVLEALATSPEWREQLKKGATSVRPFDNRAYFDLLRSIYDRWTRAEKLQATSLKIDAYEVGLLPHRHWKEPAPPRHILNDDRVTNVGTEMPLECTNLRGQALATHFDVIGSPTGRALEHAVPLKIAGWSYSMDHSLSGDIYVVLVNEKLTLFGLANRIRRDDVSEKRSGAPDRAGFGYQFELQGQWSNGSFRVVLLNRHRQETLVYPTVEMIELKDGLVQRRWQSSLSEHSLQWAVARLQGRLSEVNETVSPRAKLALIWQKSRHHLDEISAIRSDLGNVSAGSSVHIRGWCFSPSLDGDDSTTFVALFHAGTREIRFLKLGREERPDVVETHTGAPLFCGFNGEIPAKVPSADGDLHVVVCCADSRSITCRLTPWVLVKSDGLVRSLRSHKTTFGLARSVRSTIKRSCSETLLWS